MICGFNFMSDFKQKEILSGSKELIRLLKQSRERASVSLEEVAEKIGINKEYLRSIEEGDFEALPEGLYARNYLRQYARFLGLDDQVLLEDFSKEKIEPGKFSKKDLFSRKAPSWKFFLAIPKVIKNSLIVLGVALCVLYVAYSLTSIISAPSLEIFNPETDKTFKTAVILVEGKTDQEAEVYINEDLILIDKEGYFKKEINLNKGVNLITITSQKKYSRRNVVERKVLLE